MSKTVKWLVLGFLGTMSLVVITVLVLAWKFSPLIRIDSDRDKVAFLAGMIVMDNKTHRLRIGGLSLNDDLEYKHFDGSRSLEGTSVKRIHIPFTNGKLELTSTSEREVRWNCNLNQKDEGRVIQRDGELVIDLGKARGAQCGFRIPSQLSVSLDGANGEVRVNQPGYDLDAHLANGQVEVRPDPGRKYVYDMRVTNGVVDSFESSPAEGALRISVALTNGRIRRD